MQGSNMDPEELEAWLAEVELVHDKIKKIQPNSEIQVQKDDQAAQKQKIIKQEKIKKKKDKEQQSFEDFYIQSLKDKKVKGDKKDYANFCGFCHREYIKPTEICERCNRPTMTWDQRCQQIIDNMEKMKMNQVRKSEKKQRLELMQKTEKISNKNSTNYDKWKYYTSSEEETDHPPIPKLGQKYKGQDKDQEEKKKKHNDDVKMADELKQKGNSYYKKGDYDNAVQKYSEALELCKDNKVLWLNRAIAYIKLKSFSNAINDCTQVINYAQRYEEGYLQSCESCFKAFLRRAMAYRQSKNYQDALNDVNEAINLVKDKEAIHLREEILELIKHSEQKELKKSEETLPFKEVIDKFNLGKENFDLLQLFKNFRERPDECIPYFQEKDGITKLIEVINNEEKTHDEQNLLASLPILILQLYLEKSIIYQEYFICQKNGIDILLSKIRRLLKKAEGKKTSAIYDTVQDYIEALNILDDEKIRVVVQSNNNLIVAIYPEFWDRITDLYKDEFRLVNVFLSLCSNLLYGKTQLKSVFIQNSQNIITRIGQILEIVEPIPIYQTLYDSISNLMSNLLTETSLRMKMYEVQFKNLFFNKFLHLLTTKMNQENAIAVLVNLTYQIDDKSKLQYVTDSLKLPVVLIDLLKSPNKVVIERSFTVLAKCLYNDNIYIITQYLKEYPAALKVLLQMLNVGPIGKVQNQLERGQELFQLLGQLKNLLFSETELIFCNSCVVIGLITEIVPHSPVVNGQSPLQFFQQIIPHLLTVIRDQRGNMRKNAGILLAKLSKDEKNLQTIRSLHGIEILNSVIGFII